MMQQGYHLTTLTNTQLSLTIKKTNALCLQYMYLTSYLHSILSEETGLQHFPLG